MEEIKVGEYVRTENGHIDKIINIERYNEEEKWLVGENFRKSLDNGYYGRTTDNDILKHSPNIIDLIEPGDVIEYDSIYRGNVLKMEVIYTCEKADDYKFGEGFVGTDIDEYIRIYSIKTIVTKEQFKNAMYEV